MTATEIKDLIYDRLGHYRDKNPDKHSYQFIGTRTNLSVSFVERACKNRLGDSLDSKKILALSKLVCDEDETHKIAQYFANKLLAQSSILKDAIFAKFVKENDLLLEEELEEMMGDEQYFIPYVLAAVHEGIELDEIEKVGGQLALQGTKTLASKGFLVKKGNKYFPIKNDFSYSFEVMKKIISFMPRFYNTDHVGQERNYIHCMVKGLSRAGLKQWQEEHKRHHLKLRELSTSYPGNLEAFSISCLDSLRNVLPVLVLLVGSIFTPISSDLSAKESEKQLSFSSKNYNDYFREENIQSITLEDKNSITSDNILKYHYKPSSQDIIKNIIKIETVDGLNIPIDKVRNFNLHARDRAFMDFGGADGGGG